MPTATHPDPSRATRARVTWHTISWDPKKSICCGRSRFFSTLFLCQKKTLGSPPPCSCVRGNGMTQRLRWPHLLCLLGACGRGEVEGNKVKAPWAARMGPASWWVQPRYIHGWLLGRPVEWMQCWGLLGCGSQTVEDRWTKIVPCIVPQALGSCRVLYRPQELHCRRLPAASASAVPPSAWFGCRAFAFPLSGVAQGPELLCSQQCSPLQGSR